VDEKRVEPFRRDPSFEGVECAYDRQVGITSRSDLDLEAVSVECHLAAVKDRDQRLHDRRRAVGVVRLDPDQGR